MADGVIAGKLEIPVEADTSTFEERLRRKIEAAADRVEAKVRVVLDDAGRLREELQARVQEAADGVEAKIKATFDTDGMRAELVTAVVEATAGVEARVTAAIDADQLRAELETKARAATEGFHLKVQTKVDGVVDQVLKSEAEAQAAADAKPVDVPVKLDEKGLRARLLGLIGTLRAEAAAAPDVEIKTKVDTGKVKELAGLLRPGMFVGIASLIQPLIALLGQAGAGAVSLVSAMSPAVGVVGALAGGITSLVAVLGTAMIGFGGFTKAIGNYAKAQQQLKTAQQSLVTSQQSVNSRLAQLTPAQQAAIKNYNRLKTAQGGYSAQLAKLSPQERSAVSAATRLAGAYSATAKQHQNLARQLDALSPAQRKAVDASVAAAAAHRSNTAAIAALTPAQRKLVTNMASLQRQSKQVAAAQKAVDDALKGLSPSAKTAALAIYGLKSAWDKTKKGIQESIFSRFAKDIDPVAKATLPLLQTQLSKVGAAIGGVLHNAAGLVRTPLFRAQFRTLTDQAASSVTSLGASGLKLATAFGNVAVASIPLQNRMLGVVSSFAAWALTVTSGLAAGEKMRRFFDDAGTTAGKLGDILGHVAEGLFKVFSAGRQAGNNLLGGLQADAQRFATWASSPQGFGHLKKFFDDAVPSVHALGQLVGALGKALGHLAEDNNLAGMLNKLTQAIPGVEQVLSNFGRDIGPTIIDAFSRILDILGQLSTAAGPIASVARTIDSVATAIDSVLQAVPGLGPAIGALLGIVAVVRVWQVASGALTTLIVKLVSTKLAATTLVPVMDRLGVSLTTVGKKGATASSGLQSLVGKLGVYGAVVTMLGALNSQVDDASIGTGSLSKAFDDLLSQGKTSEQIDLLGKGFGDLGSGLKELADPGLGRRLDDFQNSVAGVLSFNQFGDTRGSTDRTQFIADLHQVDDALSQMVKSGQGVKAGQIFDELNKKAVAGGAGVNQLKNELPEYTDAMKGAAVATKKQGDAAGAAAPAVATLGSKMSTAASAADTMKSKLDAVLGLFQSVPEAEAGLADAVDNATAAVGRQTKKFVDQRGAFDISKKSGRDLQQQLIAMVAANANVADAVLRTTGSQAKANDAWNTGVQKIRDHLIAMGFSSREADKLATKYGSLKDAVKAVPGLLNMKVQANGLDAAIAHLASLGTFVRKLNGKTVTIRVREDGSAAFTSVDAQNHVRTSTAHSTGGLIRGKGGPEDDANVTRVSTGEFIVRASRTKRFATLLQAINSGSEKAIQAALSGLSSAGSAVSGIAARASAAIASTDVTAPAYRPTVAAARAAASPVVVNVPAPDTGRPGKTVIVDADGQLIGTMRTAARQTHAGQRRVDRLGGIGTWGAAPAWG